MVPIVFGIRAGPTSVAIVAALAWAATFAVIARRSQRIRFAVSDEGIEAWNWARTGCFRWEEIASLKTRWMLGNLSVVTVTTRDGRRFPIHASAGFRGRKKEALIANLAAHAREHGVEFDVPAKDLS
ncbi:MAG: PH domain-containing protein [Gaiellaceae bacterium]